ncbi:GNAT family N-acetyltransferase [Shewanella sp. OMA3-2]|uniref:GNAT family N-acetyltransferase n=1 Tax=Shewanella sp. OMA3-2 TaxID=2908650 RepID=UPI001F192C86|nr:GNAT family N-acetyltransferase [Shewanella sp. OMA3-2]UJF23519.1 GNAT family N-acetyltransferase [Shewanella sp. OMA3-2]
MIVETERLVLRPFTANDVHSLFLLNSLPDILTYIPMDPFTEESQAADIFENVIKADYQQHGFGRWAVHHKVDNRVIGFCGPKYLPEFDKVELGYRYFPEYWGKGIGYEAAQAALNTFKPLHGIELAIALILHGNVGSEAVARKVGMSVFEQSEYCGHKVHVYQCDL